MRSATEPAAELFSSVLDELPVAVWIATPQALSLYANRAAVELLGEPMHPGLALATVPERYRIYQGEGGALYPAEQLPIVRALLTSTPSSADDLVLQRGEATQRVEMRAAPIQDRGGRVSLVVATLVATAGVPASVDAAAVSTTASRVAKNLALIGELAAGVAHEINTPMQYIGDNTAFLGVTLRRLLDVVGCFERLVALCRNGQPVPADVISGCERELARGRLPFLREQAPTAIEQMLAGVEQVRNIVQALKEFSHPGDDKPVLVDVNNLARMASTVTRNAWRYAADLTLDLCESPRRVRGFPQELGQVLINLIVNAAHAVEERNSQTGALRQGKIIIRTRSSEDCVELEVEDDGPGIPEAIRERVMEPFFTTKPAGKGTGQGLPLARRVVEERHHGRLCFDTQVGVGTTFRVVLPACGDE